MAFCGQCGREAEQGERFCAYCGSPLDRDTAVVPVETEETRKEKLAKSAKKFSESLLGYFFRYSDSTYRYHELDRKSAHAVAMLSYLSVLFLVPLLSMRESPFAQYHAGIGVNLFCSEVFCGILGWILIHFFGNVFLLGILLKILFALIGVFFLIVCIFGAVNAWNGKAREFLILMPIKMIRR